MTLLDSSSLIANALAIAAFMMTGPLRAQQPVILATTTSVRDSGLMEKLLPLFEARTGVKVKTIAVGTGHALKMGERGEADILFVHAPAAELAFMQEGFGTARLPVMHNFFVIVGPPFDPAGIGSADDIGAVLGQIARTESLFISRGDRSGTHQKEKELWLAANIEPGGAWYRESGQGMSSTLQIAYQLDAYTVSDIGTFLASPVRSELEIFLGNDSLLFNPYHVITVSSTRSNFINTDGANALAHFMVSPEVRDLIKEFRADEFGRSLFVAGIEPSQPRSRDGQ